MRYLFTTMPGGSHLFPMVPLIRAARLAGHDVLVATSGGAARLGVTAGLPVVDVAPGRGTDVLMDKLTTDTLQPDLPDEQLMELMGVAMREIGDRMADGIVETARAWGAEALVYEPGLATGLIAARALGIPAAVHGVGLRHPTYWGMYYLGGIAERLGLDEPPLHPDAEVTYSPASLEALNDAPGEDESVVDVLPMRLRPYNGASVIPPWALTPGARPRVVATMGSAPATGGEGYLLTDIVRGTERLDVELVVTAGKSELSALPDPLPAHVRLVDWLPLSELLPTCDAVVHHGGMGTMYTAYATGVPQITVPPSGGSPAAHEVTERRGAGVTLLPRDVTPDSVAKAVREVLAAPGYRAASREVAAEMAAMPEPSAVVARLTELFG
ncbi:nucleotide disphospho-sugar-binding domain-containing protein [Streptomyces sp. NPDC048172]|uniref:nucleotide disphospho-sugar-binding domain-containing protein n=1 Tax=Streptomyces sp. NPDC048172 TaxID=3365505 RepID=UPI003719349F